MACNGITTGVCTGLSNDEPCQAPRVYSPTFPELEGIELSYGPPFTITWDIGTLYPDHTVRGFIRLKDTIGYSEDDLENVARDLGTIALGSTSVTGQVYRITLRPESATEFGNGVTLEVTAEATGSYPLGQSLIVLGSDEVLLGTEYIYE